MATIIASGAVLGSVSYPGHYASLRADTVSYDSIVRDGKRVTIKGLKVSGNHYGSNFVGGNFGWTKTFYYKYWMWDGNTNTVSGDVQKRCDSQMTLFRDSGWWTTDPWTFASNWDCTFHDITFTADPNETSRVFRIGGCQSQTNNFGDQGTRDSSTPCLAFKLSYPKANSTFSVSGNNLTFDVYIDGIKQGSSVTTLSEDGEGISSFSTEVLSGQHCVVKNIKPNAGYRLSDQTHSSYSYIAAGNTITVLLPEPIAVKHFSLDIKNGSADLIIASDYAIPDAPNGVSNYSADYDVGSVIKVTNIRANSGCFFDDDNSITKPDVIYEDANEDISLQYSAINAVAPSGGQVSVLDENWNSVTCAASILDYGVPDDIDGRYVEAGIASPDATSYDDVYATARLENSLSTGEQTITHENLVGCSTYKIGWLANNGCAQTDSSTNKALDNTIRYLPPYPIKDVKCTLKLSTSSVFPNRVVYSLDYDIYAGKMDGIENAVDSEQVYMRKLDEYANGQLVYSTGWSSAPYYQAFLKKPHYSMGTSGPFYSSAIDNIVVSFKVANNSDWSKTTSVWSFNLPVAALRPKPPIIDSIAWSNDNRTLSFAVKYNGAYDNVAKAGMEKISCEVSYDADFSTVIYSEEWTSEENQVSLSYLKPNADLYIRSKCWTKLETSVGESDWATTVVKTHRPIWGVAKKDGMVVNIVDMVQADENGNLSPRDWIESRNFGKNRITKIV